MSDVSAYWLPKVMPISRLQITDQSIVVVVVIVVVAVVLFHNNT
jgi:hypothetical protein